MLRVVYLAHVVELISLRKLTVWTWSQSPKLFGKGNLNVIPEDKYKLTPSEYKVGVVVVVGIKGVEKSSSALTIWFEKSVLVVIE